MALAKAKAEAAARARMGRCNIRRYKCAAMTPNCRRTKKIGADGCPEPCARVCTRHPDPMTDDNAKRIAKAAAYAAAKAKAAAAKAAHMARCNIRRYKCAGMSPNCRRIKKIGADGCIDPCARVCTRHPVLPVRSKSNFPTSCAGLSTAHKALKADQGKKCRAMGITVCLALMKKGAALWEKLKCKTPTAQCPKGKYGVRHQDDKSCDC